MLLNTKGQYIKELNTHEGSAIKNFLQRQVLPDTRELYMKVNENKTFIKGGSDFSLFQLGTVGKDKGLGCVT